jgi:hypothetical protein
MYDDYDLFIYPYCHFSHLTHLVYAFSWSYDMNLL